jgi:hypothetical protein
MKDTVIVAGDMRDFPLTEQWGWDYRRRANLGWLTDVLWWALRKLGAIHPHMGVVHQWRFQGKVKDPDVLKAIYEAVDIEMVHRRPGEYAVVMGIEDYTSLMHQSRDNMPPQGFAFTAGPFGYRGETFGIPVHVVNTMQGIAAIPRVIIEQQRNPA